MSIVAILTVKAAEGKYAELEQVFKTILPETASRPGAEVIRAAGDPETSTFVVYEQWESADAQAAYRAWSAENRDPAMIGSLLGEPPKIEQFDHIF